MKDIRKREKSLLTFKEARIDRSIYSRENYRKETYEISLINLSLPG